MFISEYLKENCPDLDLTFATFVISDFFKWTLKKKLTNIKIEIIETNAEDNEEVII